MHWATPKAPRPCVAPMGPPAQQEEAHNIAWAGHWREGCVALLCYGEWGFIGNFGDYQGLSTRHWLRQQLGVHCDAGKQHKEAPQFLQSFGREKLFIRCASIVEVRWIPRGMKNNCCSQRNVNAHLLFSRLRPTSQ